MTAEHDASSTRPQVTSEEGERFFALLSDADRHRIWQRMLNRPERKAPAAAPLTDFDRAFQAHVGPRLEGYVRLGGYLVFLGLERFSEAHARVMRVALKYGAEHLSEAAFAALEEWIDQALVQAIDAGVPDGLVTPVQLARIARECGP